MMGQPKGDGVVACVFIGSGGHASVLLDCLEHNRDVVVAGLLARERERWGTRFHGIPVLGGDDLLPSLHGRGITHFVVAVGGSSDNNPRRILFEKALAAGLAPLSVVHPSSIVSPSASIGPGCQLLPGSIVNAGARLGSNVIVNSAASVEHDCDLGDHVHVATGARLASTVSVGTGAHIGAGATIIQLRHVGDWAIVGAGAVVVGDVADRSVVVGVPAKPMARDVSGPEPA
jgi:sugar O-acyltransferase (sialic acid O-acetyltransferase NeuD family)